MGNIVGIGQNIAGETFILRVTAELRILTDCLPTERQYSQHPQAE